MISSTLGCDTAGSHSQVANALAILLQDKDDRSYLKTLTQVRPRLCCKPNFCAKGLCGTVQPMRCG